MLLGILQQMRSYRESWYDYMEIAANMILEDIDSSEEFPTESEVRPRRTKKWQFDYEKAVKESSTEENKSKTIIITIICQILFLITWMRD